MRLPLPRGCHTLAGVTPSATIRSPVRHRCVAEAVARWLRIELRSWGRLAGVLRTFGEGSQGEVALPRATWVVDRAQPEHVRLVCPGIGSGPSHTSRPLA